MTNKRKAVSIIALSGLLTLSAAACSSDSPTTNSDTQTTSKSDETKPVGGDKVDVKEGKVENKKFVDAIKKADASVKTLNNKTTITTKNKTVDNRITIDAIIDKSNNDGVKSHTINNNGEQSYEVISIGNKTWLKSGEEWIGPQDQASSVAAASDLIIQLEGQKALKKVTYEGKDEKGHKFKIDGDVYAFTGAPKDTYDKFEVTVWTDDNYIVTHEEVTINSKDVNTNIKIEQSKFNEEVKIEAPKDAKPLPTPSVPSQAPSPKSPEPSKK